MNISAQAEIKGHNKQGPLFSQRVSKKSKLVLVCKVNKAPCLAWQEQFKTYWGQMMKQEYGQTNKMFKSKKTWNKVLPETLSGIILNSGSLFHVLFAVGPWVTAKQLITPLSPCTVCLQPPSIKTFRAMYVSSCLLWILIN